MAADKFIQTWKNGEANILVEHLDFDITEVHGLICGLIAGGCANDVSAYMPNIVNVLNSGDALSSEMKEWLVDFFNQISTQYQQMDSLIFPFEDLLVSADDTIYYLSMWASAFLIGFGCSFGSEELSTSGRELIEEISQFTQVESEDIASEEELDNIVVTFVEHLKVCAMSLYADYGAVTGGKIAIDPEDKSKNSPIQDGELVIGENGIHLADLMNHRRYH